MNKIIVIVGPTGVGKTKLSIELAKLYDGEIINADSMQIYKELNIGTAKIKEEEKDNIPHHLFDIREIDEMYTVYDYQKDCRIKINEILSRTKTPILVGGTGLYIKAALYDYQFFKEEIINNNYENYANEELYKAALKIDKNIDIHLNNRKRLIRYLNKPDKETIKTDNILYDVLFIGLTTNRENLYNKINSRVDLMIRDGLIKEVEDIYNKNIRSKAITIGIGYKELYKYFDHEISLNESIELIKRNSRRYAKRQYTWFNNQMNITWFDVDYDEFDNTINIVKEYIKNSLI